MAGGTLGLPAGLPNDNALDAQPEYEVGEPESTGTHINSSFGPDDDAALVRWINKEITQAETSHISAQREAMREADRFQHSHQLSDADAAKLAADRRPDTVVNEVQKFIRFASGIERRSPTALIFAARTMEDEKASILSEQITKQYEWFCDQSQANFARSEAFEHRLVGGIGCLDYGLTRVTNPAGAPRCSVVDPHELLWPQCLVADTGVRCPPIYAAYRRLYSGELIHVTLENGKTLSGTPNHPILTISGWKALGALNPSDQVIDGSLIQSLHIAPGYFDDMESSLEECVNSFAVRKGTPWANRTASKDQFYGDGVGSEVYEVTTSKELWREILREELRKELQKVLFSGSSERGIWGQAGTLETCLNSVMVDSEMAGHLPYAHSRGVCLQQSLCRHLAEVFRIAKVGATWRAASQFQTQIDGATVAPSESAGDFETRKALVVIKSGNLSNLLGRNGFHELPSLGIRKCERSSGHDVPVFDLRTDCGFFLAQGIISSNCSKQNLGLGTASPVRWMARESHMDVDEAVHKWPDYALFLRAAAGGEDSSNDQFPDFGYGPKKAIPYVVPWIMTAPLNKTGGGGKEAKPGKVPIVEFQHYDDEQGYYFFDPLQKDDTWLSNSDFRKYRVRLKQLFKLDITDYDAKQYHRVYKRSFLLQRRILLDGPDKLPTQQAGYTWNVMTGMWDRTDKVFYGIIRVLIAPQRYTNAMFRQVLEIMGASTKGGYLAETGAITIPQKNDIEETGSRPGSINIIQAGAISGNKILPKPVPTLPQGSMEVLGFCIDLMEKLNGLSTSLIGADQSNTPGVALRKRLTNGMILLAAEFDSLNRFRKREGMLTFELMKLLADDRLIRIGGPFDGQTVKMTKDPFALEYDIVLDENEQDPNLRQYYTEQITAIAPILIRTGNFFPELLDYINLPAQFRQRLKQGMQQMEQQKQQMAMQGLSVGGRGKPRSLEEIQAQVGLTKARAAKDLAQARTTMVKPLQEGMRSIFDMQRAKHEQSMKEKQLSLEALEALFAGLQAAQSGNQPSKEKR